MQKLTRPVLEFASRSHRGCVRQRNEDCAAVHTRIGTMIVADGMGGARCGDVASRVATDVIGQRLSSELSAVSPTSAWTEPHRVRQLGVAAIVDANLAVYEHAEAHPECLGMGTTVVVACFGNRWVMSAHVGDSRLYRVRGRRLDRLTRDHSVIQEAVNRGVFADLDQARRAGINANVLSRALGVARSVEVSDAVIDIADGDIFLACTDGLTNMVTDDDIFRLLSSGHGELGVAADALVDRACENGGTDNVTLVLALVAASGKDQ